MDSGNKGYASLAGRCRRGGSSSRKSHLKARFGAVNGGKQAWFRFPGGKLGYATPRPQPGRLVRLDGVRPCSGDVLTQHTQNARFRFAPYVNRVPKGSPEG
jgi:hypothetical protein